MRVRKINKSDGITILEVLIAMLILSMSLLLLLNMAMVALDGNDWSNHTTVVTQLMQQKLEEIRASGALTNGHDSVSGVARTWNVTNVGPHLRNVNIAMNWSDVRAREHNDSMSALIRTDSL
jgi:Tfp pilus assembly protein PilV